MGIDRSSTFTGTYNVLTSLLQYRQPVLQQGASKNALYIGYISMVMSKFLITLLQYYTGTIVTSVGQIHYNIQIHKMVTITLRTLMVHWKYTCVTTTVMCLI